MGRILGGHHIITMSLQHIIWGGARISFLDYISHDYYIDTTDWIVSEAQIPICFFFFPLLFIT